jgi:hypothetical protein
VRRAGLLAGRDVRIIGALMLCACVFFSGCGGGVRSARSSAASPTADTDVANPPTVPAWIVAVDTSTATPDKPVVWFRDGNDDGRLIAYTWDGAVAGAMRLDAGASVQPSPDGTRMIVRGARPASGGKVVRAYAGDGRWSRDSRSLCTFLTRDGNVAKPTVIALTPPAPGAGSFRTTYDPPALFTEDASTGALHHVEDFGGFSPESGPVVLSCDAAADRALVAEVVIGSQSMAHAVRLSDGATNYIDAGAVDHGGAVASPDATLAAVGTSLETSGIRYLDQIRIKDVASGSNVAELPGRAVAFADDDSRLLIGEVHMLDDVRVFHLVDWRTGRTLWTGTLPSFETVARPGSADLLIAPYEFHAPSVPGASPSYTTHPFILRADGTTTPLSGDLKPLN